ncbi:hypothetical protein DFJ73DRAFT_838350 [Zopfochytrium polystomum]|nr:hypothetical protein DFJ73DRAFT_838350 [Zopfochytrium polystomum]
MLAAVAAAIAVAASAGFASAQANTTCAPIDPADNACGFLSPAPSILTLNQASALNAAYSQILVAGCPALAPVAANIPVVYCLGGLGPCNGATYKLPTVDATGTPTNFTEVLQFYGTAKFAQVLPALAKLGVQPPCYDLCSSVAKGIIGCSLFATINKTADPCEGLPTTNCVAALGPKAGAASSSGKAASSATITGTTTSAPPASASAASTSSKSAAVAGTAPAVSMAVGAVVAAVAASLIF